MNLESLDPPYLELMIASPKELSEYAYKFNYEKGSEYVIRVVRGNKMRRLTRLFDEVAAALQFPDYFGENWDALEDCLTDLEWLPASGYVLFVSRTVEVLSEESDEQFETFVTVLSTACEEWARCKPPKPFHVFLQCTESDIEILRRRAQATLAGTPITPLSKAW